MHNMDDKTEINIKSDPSSQLFAIIAIHSLNRGPALGGCRWLEYSNFADALSDVTRLAKGMSYKSALCQLPYGGGKAVLIKPKHIKEKQRYFESFAQFVNQLDGKYITTADSGISTSELDLISKYTNFITGQSDHKNSSGDPSPYTAQGVLRGIEAAVKFKLNRSSLEGLRIAVQGVGHVGYCLVKMLYERGMRITICDVNTELIKKCQDEFNVSMVSPDEIYQVNCDVFSPCALGGVLNSSSIPKLNTAIVAGCANNQLLTEEDANKLANKNILYVPDYVINAGGLIKVAGQYEGASLASVNEKIEKIYPRLIKIFELASSQNISPNSIANYQAEQLIN